ncbi:MAG: hypothetical protein IIC23_08815 [Chloroflexi bacterium]|nr:hypothetical protein [Chloroflexota bacterium]MCH9039481.1 hypothetical protein [Chloroflexota bacterium]
MVERSTGLADSRPDVRRNEAESPDAVDSLMPPEERELIREVVLVEDTDYETG